jgi:MoaA/NifB/PqqE/SkfB family radical SAM enzyme
MIKLLNRIKVFTNYQLKKNIFTIYPTQVAIEVTNYCNLSCAICPHGKMTRAKQIMDIATFRDIIDKTKRYADFVFLYGIGESLICRNLDKMIRYTKEAGLHTYLSTNIVLMDEDWSAKLIESELDSITFAFDGCTKETYESIRVDADFDVAVKNIRSFLRMKRELKSKMEVIVQLVLTEVNKDEVSKFRSLFSARERREISQFRVKPFYDSFVQRDRVSGSKRKRCFFPWSSMFVYSDARVGLCCIDYDGEMILGDLKEEDTRAIWNSDKLNHIRDSFVSSGNDLQEICRTCVIPGKNYFRTGLLLFSTLVPTSVMRKFIPLYEKIFLVGE